MKNRTFDISVTPIFVAPGYAPITSVRRFITSTYPLDMRVIQAICDRVDGFGIQEMDVWRKIFDQLLWLLRHADPGLVNRHDADALLADGIWCLRNIYGDDLTAEQHYELERWIDYLPDAYAARCAYRERPRRGRKRKSVTDGSKYAGRYA